MRYCLDGLVIYGLRINVGKLLELQGICRQIWPEKNWGVVLSVANIMECVDVLFQNSWINRTIQLVHGSQYLRKWSCNASRYNKMSNGAAQDEAGKELGDSRVLRQEVCVLKLVAASSFLEACKVQPGKAPFGHEVTSALVQ